MRFIKGVALMAVGGAGSGSVGYIRHRHVRRDNFWRIESVSRLSARNIILLTGHVFDEAVIRSELALYQ